METLLWIIVAAVGLIAAWFLFKAVVGFLVPPELSGKAYLRKELTRRGISSLAVPDACLADFVALSKQTAEFQKAPGKPFTQHFVKGLDVAADTIQLWISDPNDRMFSSEHGSNIYRDILQKHSVGQTK